MKKRKQLESCCIHELKIIQIGQIGTLNIIEFRENTWKCHYQNCSSSKQRAGSAVYTRTKSRKAGIASAAEGDVNEVRMMEKENFRDDDLRYKCLQGYR